MADSYDAALELAGELLGKPLELPLGPGSPIAVTTSVVSRRSTPSATAGPAPSNSTLGPAA